MMVFPLGTRFYFFYRNFYFFPNVLGWGDGERNRDVGLGRDR
jgi:hypothetical protein